MVGRIAATFVAGSALPAAMNEHHPRSRRRAALWALAALPFVAFAGLYAALIYDMMTGPYRTIDIIRDEWPLYPKVTTSLGHSCEAPCTFAVPTLEPFQLTLSFPGYKDRIETVRPADWKTKPGTGRMEPAR